jgi:flagellar basal-body rod modification protein FlgD
MNTGVVDLKNGNINQGSAAKGSGANLGKEDFMKLLLTQLSQQDPLNPQDSTAYVAQLTQFANLEAVGNLGTKLDSLVNISAASNSANAVSLLGKEVRLNGNKISGPSNAFYELPQTAKSASLQVFDPSGKVVKTLTDIGTSAGLHEVKLSDLAPGNYSFEVKAFDSGGKPISASLSTVDRRTQSVVIGAWAPALRDEDQADE